MKCDIEAPSDDTLPALTRNKDYEDVLTFGFVHECYKMLKFKDVQIMPFYLMQVIGKYVRYETIHLIAPHEDTKKH